MKGSQAFSIVFILYILSPSKLCTADPSGWEIGLFIPHGQTGYPTISCKTEQLWILVRGVFLFCFEFIGRSFQPHLGCNSGELQLEQCGHQAVQIEKEKNHLIRTMLPWLHARADLQQRRPAASNVSGSFQ